MIPAWPVGRRRQHLGERRNFMDGSSGMAWSGGRHTLTPWATKPLSSVATVEFIGEDDMYEAHQHNYLDLASWLTMAHES